MKIKRLIMSVIEQVRRFKRTGKCFKCTNIINPNITYTCSTIDQSYDTAAGRHTKKRELNIKY